MPRLQGSAGGGRDFLFPDVGTMKMEDVLLRVKNFATSDVRFLVPKAAALTSHPVFYAGGALEYQTN